MASIYNSFFVKKIKISDTTHLFYFTKPKDFEFDPGQYVSIEVIEHIKRSYSISSSPFEKYLECVVDISPMGVGTQYLLNLKKGDLVPFFGPLGFMILPKDLNQVPSLNLVCSGSGIGPFKSFCNYLRNIKYKGIVNLIYSEKYSKDFVKIEKIPNINIYKTVTREISENYLNGRVIKFLDKLDYNKKSLFYICGNMDMLMEVFVLLQQKGVDSDRIIKESFYS
ncbi:hypothetical protein COV24_04295 [candidate division WWE3 bacterium CG10_big_fil_rev_8_21_14_0_10_32_10]|uniref:FAD-binding FR-type domain-containing protein n=1 Tax=candidate division WWE3 bacterium CG10_big_fil_rev_8_21_14_0_10_32_10 TaxID=1975090 RepID=A0A2H0R9L0_UNCKA|nr:MAG: hypothetical protein COV24_04295 [candidate division WWE3 bacterium CG10_big_fil_rev_8_21_14_0_10_32_10]